MSDFLADYLKAQLDRETVRYAASRTVFCPKCQNILDMRCTVVIEIPDPESNGTTTRVMCSDCYDALIARLRDANPGETIPHPSIDVTDGRNLWAAEKPRVIHLASHRHRVNAGVDVPACMANRRILPDTGRMRVTTDTAKVTCKSCIKGSK